MGLFHDLSASGLTAEQIAYAAEAVGQFPVAAGSLEGTLTSETDGRGGTTISHNPRSRYEDARLMRVVQVTPAKDFTDARYLLFGELPTGKTPSDPIDFTGDGTRDDQYLIATNLSEWDVSSGGTHLLQAGARVLVFHLYTAEWGDFYVFDRALAGPYLVQIAGFISGAAGKYTGGHIAPASGDFPTTGDLVATDLGGVVSGAVAVPDFVIVNVSEVRRANHAHILAKDSIWVANTLRYNSDGKLVAEIQAGPAAWELFRVNLAHNAGADGTAPGTPASWTYDVTARNGEALGANLGPERPRVLSCATNQATTGIAYYTDTGTLILAEAWETFGGGSCS